MLRVTVNLLHGHQIKVFCMYNICYLSYFLQAIYYIIHVLYYVCKQSKDQS